MINALVYDANLNYALFLARFLRRFDSIKKIRVNETPASSFVQGRKIDLDLVLWGFSGNNPDELEFFSRTLEERPYVQFVCLVNLNSPNLAERLLLEGAAAVAYKTLDSKKLGSLCETLLEVAFPEIPEHLDYEPAIVTDRESEILFNVALGYENHEISKRFNLSIETVRTHLKAINRKLKAKAREQTVAQGFRYKVLY